jgi:hypothetical protein
VRFRWPQIGVDLCIKDSDDGQERLAWVGPGEFTVLGFRGPVRKTRRSFPMSDQPITLEFLSRQIVGLRDEVRSLVDQMGVLTAIVLRLDRDGARRDERDTDMLNEMRAMVRQHQRFNERLRALEPQ